ncbi:MAG: hypothetical protein ACPIGG_09325 [Akkermansiaceae bacterium]
MEPGKETQCPNCAELWKRLDEANEAKAEAIREKARAMTWLNIFRVLAIISGIVAILRLIR